MNKIEDILSCDDLNHYKNLRYDFRNLKRVHVNTSFVIVFYEKEDTIYFIDYDHHDKIYKNNKHKK